MGIEEITQATLHALSGDEKTRRYWKQERLMTQGALNYDFVLPNKDFSQRLPKQFGNLKIENFKIKLIKQNIDMHQSPEDRKIQRDSDLDLLRHKAI